MKRIFLFTAFIFAVMSIKAQTLNVATYNIRLHTKVDYKTGDGWQERRDVMCNLIAFSAFDIFGTQEVCHDQLMDMLERLPDYDYIGVARDDGATAGEYSPIFYRKNRFNVLKSGTFWLSETPEKVSYGWDADCRRVCSWAQLQDKQSGKTFWFFNTHMDHKGIKAREEGAKLLIAKIREMCKEDDKVILTGDFNVAQGSTPYNTFVESRFMKDAYDMATVKFAPAGTFNDFNTSRDSEKRIDHIFVSGFDVERYGILTQHYWSKTDGKNGNIHQPSDHYPVQIFTKL